MSNTAYYERLQRDLPATLKVDQIIHGISWTAAVLSDGRTGVAMHTEGESFPRMFSTLEGRPLSDAGCALLSWNMEEASEALAAVNAFYNHLSRCAIKPGTGALDGIDIAGKTLGFVGHLLGHSDITESQIAPAKQVFILEREPKPGDYPDTACEYLLPLCDVVVITGSAAINKTLPRLLELSAKAVTILTGPSVSFHPGLLELGIDRLQGRAITEPRSMLQAIVEKRCSVNNYSVAFQWNV